MKLSVIVPVYNGEKTIEKCILSLINQDMNDMEIVVVNDGSVDKTIEILNELKNKYPLKSIRIINKENQGLPQARKTGIKNVTSDYIGFVDADDWVEPNMYSEMMKAIDIYGFDVVCCDILYEYNNKTDIHTQMLEEGIPYSGKQAMEAINNRYGVFPNMWNKIYRRDLFEQITFLHGNFCGEDYSIMIQLMQKKHCKVGVVKTPFYHYVQIEGSMGVGGYGKAQELGYLVYKRILSYVHKKYDIQTVKEYDNYFVNEFMGFVLSMGYNGNYDYQRIKWIQQFIRKRIGMILRNRYNSFLCKGTALVLCFSYRLVVYIFNIYRRKMVKWN